MTASVEQLRSLAAYIRRNATANRAVERIGPFVATFTDRSDHPFLNYAIPDDGANPSDCKVAALAAACRRRGRTPRFEYFPALAPVAMPRLPARRLHRNRRAGPHLAPHPVARARRVDA